MSFTMIAESEGDIMTQSSRCKARSSVGNDHPKLMEEFSNFGDVACGEPAAAQHLVLDFTPDPEVDNQIIQKKVCDFWAFINSVPEIHNLMVKPERRDVAPKPTTTSEVQVEVVKYQPENSGIDMSATACSMLEAIDQKGLITRTFETKLPQVYCPLDSNGSEGNEDIQQKDRKHDPMHRRRSKPCLVKKLPSLEAKTLCMKLEEWDKKNPKCMDPPGHPPALQHCIIQGQEFET